MMMMMMMMSHNSHNRSFQVHITSEVPDTPGPLTIHCKSRDNDLGEQLMNNGQDFHWSFKENLFGTTLFFCGFGWNGKIQSFDVFSDTLDEYGHRPQEPWLCVWIVRPDQMVSI
ncbi:unnamed protein product [Camellia sinensis]